MNTVNVLKPHGFNSLLLGSSAELKRKGPQRGEAGEAGFPAGRAQGRSSLQSTQELTGEAAL